MRDLSEDSNYEDVVLMMSTQLIKSETGLNWLGSIIDQTPAPIMIVQATVDTAKRYSRQRVGPMIAACPRLRRKVKDARSRDAGNTLQMKEFPGGVLVITGSNSAPGLASMPARFIHFDERDDYEDDVAGQGEPTHIARARQDSFPRRKRLTTSSPKRPKGQSRIEEEFNAGTRFYYHVACPHCQASQRLEFHSLTMRESGDVVYACPHCGAEIDEHLKPDMFADGEWIAEVPDAKIRSYHLNALYSPLGWLSWRELIAEYADAVVAQQRGDDAPMKAFLNTRLAQTFEEKTDKLESDDLRDRAEDYPLREVPAMACALTAGVDVQDNRFEVLVTGWGPREESWAVDYMQLYCDPGSDEAWQKLDDYLKTNFKAADGRALPVAATAIDTGGHFTHQVYAFCRNRKRTFAVKGAERPGLPVKGKLIPKGVRLWFVGTDSAKDLLHNRMRMKTEGPGFLHLSDELPDEFFEGMTSEERKRIKTARGMRSTWVKKKPNARNEPLDCSVYSLFAAHVLDLPRYTETMWNRLRQRQEKARDASKEQAEAEVAGLPAAPATAPTVAAKQPSQVPRPRFIPRRSGGGFIKGW